MSGSDDAEDERNESSRPNRRSFLRTVGATAGSAAVLGNVDSVTAASSGPFAPLKREQLTGDALDEAVESALADDRTEALLADLPGGANRLKTQDAQAYRIVNTSDDDPITQVLIPVPGRDATMGYARSEGETAVGLELEDGRYLQSIEHPERGPVVQHKRVAEGREKDRILGRVAERHDLSDHDQKEATVAVVEETETAYLQIPASETASDNASDSAIIATVDTDGGDVTIQGEASDCVISCLATSTKFWGACWTCCCQWCWNGLGCAACAGCVGITLSKCGLQCAGKII
jgi:hypothetical protein